MSRNEKQKLNTLSILMKSKIVYIFSPLCIYLTRNVMHLGCILIVRYKNREKKKIKRKCIELFSWFWIYWNLVGSLQFFWFGRREIKKKEKLNGKIFCLFHAASHNITIRFIEKFICIAQHLNVYMHFIII